MQGVRGRRPCGRIIVEDYAVAVVVCCVLRDVLQMHNVVSYFFVRLFVCFVSWRFIFLRLYDMELVLQHVRDAWEQDII